MRIRKKSIAIIAIAAVCAAGCSVAAIMTASALQPNTPEPPAYYLGSDPEEVKAYEEAKAAARNTDEYRLMKAKTDEYTEKFNEVFSQLKEKRGIDDNVSSTGLEWNIAHSDAADVILDEMQQESKAILQKYGCIDQDITFQELVETACDAVVEEKYDFTDEEKAVLKLMVVHHYCGFTPEFAESIEAKMDMSSIPYMYLLF